MTTTEFENPVRTITVSAAVAVGCALLVTVAVGYLRPLQIAANNLEARVHILQAAGYLDVQNSTDPDVVSELFEQIDVRLVEIATGSWIAGNGETFDYMQAAADPTRSLELSSTADLAKLGRRSLVMPVYQLLDNGRTVRIILPVYGKGMWSEIHAYLALENDMQTIASLVIHSHGETPGIGDRIEAKDWLQNWQGKRATSPLRLATTSTAVADSNGIDTITGATVTTQSLVATVNFWLGDDGYGPLIAKLTETIK